MRPLNKPLQSIKLAEAVHGEHIGVEKDLYAVASIERGSANDIGFLADEVYAHLISQSRIGVLLVANKMNDFTGTQIIVDNVRQAWRTISEAFDVAQKADVVLGIHPSANISSTAKVGENVSIAAGVVIGEYAVIGNGVQIEPNAYIADTVEIGDDCRIGPGVRIMSGTTIGKRCNILANAVIGERGFGNVFEDGQWKALPQLGGVRVGNDVEIGAGTMIDRGAVEDTVIGNGVKLDNLIQIAHNVVIGDHTAIAGCCVIAGSVIFGKYCIVGGATVFAGHIHICDGAQFTGHSSISKSITEPGAYSSGIPVMPVKQWHRFVAKLRMLTRDKSW